MPDHRFKRLIIIFFKIFIVSYQAISSTYPHYSVVFRIDLLYVKFIDRSQLVEVKPVPTFWLWYRQPCFFSKSNPNPALSIFYHFKLSTSATMNKIPKSSIRVESFYFFIIG